MKKLLLSLFLMTTAMTAMSPLASSQEVLDSNQQVRSEGRDLTYSTKEEGTWTDEEFAKNFMTDDRFWSDPNNPETTTVNWGKRVATINTEYKLSKGIGYIEGIMYQLIRSTLSMEFPRNIELELSNIPGVDDENFNENGEFIMIEGEPFRVKFVTQDVDASEEYKSYDQVWTFKFTGLKESAIADENEAAKLIDTSLTTFNLNVDSSFSDVELFSVDQIKNNLKNKNMILPPHIQLTIVDSFRKNALYPDEIIAKYPNEKFNNFELKIRNTETGKEVVKKIILNNIEKLKLSFETETDAKNNLTLLKISNFDFIKEAGMAKDFSTPLFNPISKDGGKTKAKNIKASTRSACVSSEVKTNCWDSEEGIFYINNNSVGTDEVEVTFPSVNGFFGDEDSNESKTVISLNPVVIKDNTMQLIIIFGVVALVVLIIFAVVTAISIVVRRRKNKIKLYISDEDIERYKKNGLSKKFIKSLKHVVLFNEVEKAGFESGMEMVHVKKKVHKAEKVWLESYQLTEKQLKMKKMSLKKLMVIEAFLSEHGSKKIKNKIEKWQNKQ